jgi:hypothetical protein
MMDAMTTEDEDDFDADVERQARLLADAFCDQIATVGKDFYVIATVVALSRLLEANLGLLSADQRNCVGVIVQKISDEMDRRPVRPN